MNGTGGDGDQDTPTSYKVKRPSQRVSDLAGIDNILIQIRELIQYPLLHPEIYDTLQIKPPRGVLLHGPPGCGKTMLATAIGGELGHTVQFSVSLHPKSCLGDPVIRNVTFVHCSRKPRNVHRHLCLLTRSMRLLENAPQDVVWIVYRLTTSH